MLPLLILGGMGLYGLVKGGVAVSDMSDAKDIDNSARSICGNAENKLKKAQTACSSQLEAYGSRKLRAFNTVISDFIETYGKLRNVDLRLSPELDKLKLGDFTIEQFNQLKADYNLLANSGLGLGAGLTGGSAVAFGAYSGTMMLASAGTGTAISTLSGVAATNATLAWLGGGTLAAGGGGMAMGTMVLGGLVAGPALAVFGHFIGNKADAALSTARSNLEEARKVEKETDLIINKLNAISKVVGLADSTFSKISTLLRRSNHALKNVIESEGVDYSKFSSEEKGIVLKTVKIAQLIKTMIDTPILDKDGNLVLATEKRIKEISDAIAV